MVTKKKQFEKPSMITRAYTTASSSCRQLSFRGAWRRLSLTLLVALCCHTAASAKTLTVYDGTNTSSYLPVYGYGADALETTSEFVIPSGQLGAMENGTISALTFYLSSSASAAWTATFQVYLKEISATTLTGITGPDASTVVYTGTLNATGSEMTVTFSTPYTYNGGDLLIGTYVSVKSTNYPQANFYGVSQSVNTACYKKSGTTYPQQFIPKTTFTYESSGSVVPPNNLAVSDVTTTTATVSWNGNGDSYNVRYRKQFLSEGFEGGSMPAGWTTDGPGTWSVGTGDFAETTGSHSGDKNAKIADNKRGNVTYLITPSMDLSGETSLTLSFWYINRAYVNDIDGFGVYYRVANGTWNELWSTTTAHGSWTNQEVTLTGLAANYQLGFKMTDNYGYGVGLDDIQILSSADWQTVNDITTTSTTLIGLDANTTYDFQVQGVKAGNTSSWSPIATFTTAANAVVLTDGEGLSALSAYTGQTVAVTYSRSFTSGKASTVCVPFAFDVTSAGGTFYTFKGISKSGSTYIADMTASVSTTLTPNTPYVFMPSATGDVNFSGTYAIPATLTASSATSGDWKFYGTYTRLSYGTAPMTGYVYGFASVDATVEGHDVKAGEFVRATTGAGVPPMRCYLIYKDGQAYTNARALTRGGDDEEMPQSIIVRLLDANGQTTSIGSLDMKTGEMEFDGWYSLDGSRLEGKPTKKGLYINNGKKVIIK